MQVPITLNNEAHSGFVSLFCQNNHAGLRASSITSHEWSFCVGSSSRLLEKLEKMPVTLAHMADRISQGIRTSANEIYVLDIVSEQAAKIKAFSKYLEEEVVLERKSVHRFLQGKEIKAYSIRPSGKIVIIPYELHDQRAVLIPMEEYRQRFPKASQYLLQNKTYLEAREKGRMRSTGWHGFVYPKNLEVMQSPKLLVPDIADRAAFAFDEHGKFAFTSGYGITLKPIVEESPKFLMSLLNSSLLDWYWKKISTPLRGGFYRYFTQFLGRFPVHKISFKEHSERLEHDALSVLAQRIIAAKKNHSGFDTSALSSEINARVYRLYGLTKEKIKIVEEEN